MTNQSPSILLLIARDRKEEEKSAPSEHVLRWSRALNLPIEAFTVKYVPEGALPDPVDHDLILISGSKHSAYEDLPWVKGFEAHIREWMNQKIPMLGVCFGQQIIATALGGRVEKGSAGAEVEAVEIELTDAGMKDSAFAGFDHQFKIGTFHKDVVTLLPTGTTAIAKNAKYDTQALRFNEQTIGVQFHPEFSAEHIVDIIERNKDELVANELFPSLEAAEDALEELKHSNIDQTGPKLAQQIITDLLKK